MSLKKRINKKIFNKKILFLFCAIVALFFFLGFLIGSQQKEKKFETKEVADVETKIRELSLKNFQEVEIDLRGNIVVLKHECNALFMTITQDQAISIEAALKNKTTERPLTHDIIKSILEVYNIKILYVTIHDTRHDIYLAKIFLRQGNKILSLDSRPSDAIAIALHFNSKVYVKKQILEKGEKIC